MKYDGTFACGHEGRVDIGGPGKDREWKVERAFRGSCPDCQAEKAAAREAIREKTWAKVLEMPLPELTGSEKQVAWAKDIIRNAYRYVEDLRQDFADDDSRISEACDLARKVLDEKITQSNEAKYYIDSRDLFSRWCIQNRLVGRLLRKLGVDMSFQ